MKNLINANRNLAITAVIKFQGFEKLSSYELSKVKGGTGMEEPPITVPK